jgi:alkaline phosphatase D
MTKEKKIESRGPVNTVSRRRFVQGASAAALTGPAFLWAREGHASGGSLFTLGVASGDPDARSVVLWTRLAPDPLNGGGMGHRPVRVRWEVAFDPQMKKVIRRGATIAHPRSGHAVNVVARGLPSDCWLYYRFYARGQASRLGRTRTFPSRWDHARQMRFAVANCQNYTGGYYTAYRDMLSQDLDFVVHVGDYMYEGGAQSSPILAARNHNGPETFSVEEYRNRYALYRLDPDLQDVHAELPFITTWDDHEVDNNYAGLVAEDGAPYTGNDFIDRRRNAYQVYAETMPLRPRNRLGARRGSLNLARKLEFGDLADLHVLDTRQFRDDQPAGDGFGSTDTPPPAVEQLLEGVFGEELFDQAGIEDPAASMLGWRQEFWLARNLWRSRARWNVLAQSVMVMQWNLVEAARLTAAAQIGQLPPQQQAAIQQALSTLTNVLNVDAWDGYRANRERLFHVLEALRPSNPVVLTGDIHSAWGANLLEDFSDPSSDVIAAEFVSSSISSTFGGADPRPTDFVVRASLADNPHIEFFNGLFRGYLLCDVNRHRWQTTYRAVGALADTENPSPTALVPLQSSPVDTDAVLEIEAGFNRRKSGKRLQTKLARIPI